MNSIYKNLVLAIVFLFWLLTACSEPGNETVVINMVSDQSNQLVNRNQSAIKPNFLLIVVDDVGYTDLGIYGSEISTPNIDALAQSGLLFTNFHAAPSCSPTRAMLLTSTTSHISGLGSMNEMSVADNQKGHPGYEGYLNFRVATLAELLHDTGYHTYMTGKWHLGSTEETSPAARGFEKSFALLDGGAGHLSDLAILPISPVYEDPRAAYRENGKLTGLPEDFYSTRFYAERMIDYIDANRDDNKPFFAYLAFTATHWPLQAPDESIAKYIGAYDEGYDILFEKRILALKKKGFIDNTLETAPPHDPQPQWQALSPEEQAYESKRMAIYAAMIEDVDHYLGKVVNYLKQIKQFDNTIIFFLSDNGAEGHNFYPPNPFFEYAGQCCDNSYENIGRANSYIWQTSRWARASVGPGRIYKAYPTQGGILVPAFISSPLLSAQAGKTYDGYINVMDVMPTLLEIAGIPHPGAGNYKGRQIVSMQGKSIVPLLDGSIGNLSDDNRVTAWELFTKRAIREGDWKAIMLPPPYGDGTWRLYNVDEDPAELNDLSTSQPQKLEHLQALWEQYVRENGVVIAKDLPFKY